MLFLASQSPRRRELLAQLGVAFDCLDLEVPEVVLPDETAEDYVQRVARDKARAGLALRASVAGAVVLGGDTEVVLDGVVFGKPRDAADARAMLVRLSGRSHAVLSSVWLAAEGREAGLVNRTEVHVEALDAAALEAYLATDEWRGKAGAYAIQGRFGAHVARIEGSFTGVMGLPLHETSRLLRGFGIGPGT
jgi:septum formation protein